jgi:hypothetical protein
MFADVPRCYGEFEEDHPDCTDERCDWVERCIKYALKKLRTAGLSRPRAMKAMCFECNGGTTRGPDCRGPACSLYAWMKYGELEPNLWWMEPVHTWNEGSQRARGATVIVEGDEDEPEEDESDDEDE